MAYETKLSVQTSRLEELLGLVETLPGCVRCSAMNGRQRVEFRTSGGSGGMPIADALLVEDGLIYCDYGQGADLLSHLRSLLALHFGEVTCHEL